MPEKIQIVITCGRCKNILYDQLSMGTYTEQVAVACFPCMNDNFEEGRRYNAEYRRAK